MSADGSDRVRRVTASQAAQQLTERLAEVNKAIEGAEAAVLRTRANLADEAAKRAIDPLEQIRRRYEGPDGLIAQAQRRAIAEKTVTSELTRQITVLRSREKAELDREQKRQSAASSTGGNNNQIGRTVTVAEATQIAASIGPIRPRDVPAKMRAQPWSIWRQLVCIRVLARCRPAKKRTFAPCPFISRISSTSSTIRSFTAACPPTLS